jgi:hypothetical protein
VLCRRKSSGGEVGFGVHPESLKSLSMGDVGFGPSKCSAMTCKVTQANTKIIVGGDIPMPKVLETIVKSPWHGRQAPGWILNEAECDNKVVFEVTMEVVRGEVDRKKKKQSWGNFHPLY